MWCWHCKWMAQWYCSIGSDSILTSRFHLRRISTFPWWPCTCINYCLSCSAEVSRRHRVKSVIFCILPLPHLLQAIWGIKKKNRISSQGIALSILQWSNNIKGTVLIIGTWRLNVVDLRIVEYRIHCGGVAMQKKSLYKSIFIGLLEMRLASFGHCLRYQ